MEPTVKIYLDRAKNELILSRTIFKVSNEEKIKGSLGLTKEITFYSGSITHSYYSIFYSAKAYLISRGIKTSAPNEHKKIYEEFERLIVLGELDKELGEIYSDVKIKAEELLHIFSQERTKRGRFTYKKMPQANMIPAKESIKNATKFFKSMNTIFEN